ncbi:MAG: hypothetical protein JXB36_10700 [Gammaproteobacteria bacterium]|nr:hypothetical protein [Gammaproteobacteria bacterium]
MAAKRRTVACAAGLLALAFASPGTAQSDRAVIHFADLNGSIRNWRADTDEAILIEGANRQWYRAEFFAPCVGLRFATTVAFVTDSLGNLDRFSSILVEGERCWFKTFERTNDPQAGPPPDVDEVE